MSTIRNTALYRQFRNEVAEFERKLDAIDGLIQEIEAEDGVTSLAVEYSLWPQMQYTTDRDVLRKPLREESLFGESIRKIGEANGEFLMGVGEMRHGYDKARAALDKILDLDVPLGFGDYVKLRNVMPDRDAAAADDIGAA